MEQSQELSKALEELTRATGIALDIHIQPEASKEKIDESIRQIRSLCAAYKEKYNKNYFLLNLMTGTAQDCEISERAARLHIRAVKPRYLFCSNPPKKMDETVTEVLKQLFPFQEKIYLVPVNEFQLAMLYPVKMAAHPKIFTIGTYHDRYSEYGSADSCTDCLQRSYSRSARPAFCL